MLSFCFSLMQSYFFLFLMVMCNSSFWKEFCTTYVLSVFMLWKFDFKAWEKVNISNWNFFEKRQEETDCDFIFLMKSHTVIWRCGSMNRREEIIKKNSFFIVICEKKIVWNPRFQFFLRILTDTRLTDRGETGIGIHKGKAFRKNFKKTLWWDFQIIIMFF